MVLRPDLLRPNSDAGYRALPAATVGPPAPRDAPGRPAARPGSTTVPFNVPVRVAGSRRASTAIRVARLRSSAGYFLGAAMTLILTGIESPHRARVRNSVARPGMKGRAVRAQARHSPPRTHHAPLDSRPDRPRGGRSGRRAGCASATTTRASIACWGSGMARPAASRSPCCDGLTRWCSATRSASRNSTSGPAAESEAGQAGRGVLGSA
jgi:hypothetical protein